MSARWKTLDGTPSRIIAHRGASGERPEHTLEGYALALQQGADVIEPDLVLSRDGQLFARHDVGLARSTDIANRLNFATRRRLGPEHRSDWWAADFDAAEIATLRAIQPFPGRSAEYDGRFAIPRFEEVLKLACADAQCNRRPVVVYPELKSPAYFRRQGLDPLRALTRLLHPRGPAAADTPIWVQCFDHGELKRVQKTLHVPVFPLFDRDSGLTAARQEVLDGLAKWASGIAVAKQLLRDARGDDSGLVAAAHARGLAVHAWTFRDDKAQPDGIDSEYRGAFDLGVDALFCDFPASAVRSRAQWVEP